MQTLLRRRRVVGVPSGWGFCVLAMGSVGLASCTPDVSTSVRLEVCDNGRDDDGNGLSDCDDPRCSADATCLASAQCGNDLLEGGELCDRTELAGRTCADLGFVAGTLACADDCAGFDTSGCIRGDACGNGALDGSEQCDGLAFGEASCRSRGFGSGTLACTGTCEIDDSGCSATDSCGNGVIDDGETCDGTTVPSDVDCTSEDVLGQSFFTGTLACNATCDGYDTSGCSNCGNKVLDDGEPCDGLIVESTCASEGFVAGIIGCAPDCSAIDTSACTTCGNGVIDGTELCDGADVGSATCADAGFGAGTVGCNASCDGLVITACTNCGDGTVNTEETCDTAVPITTTCAELGYASGTVGCAIDCKSYDTSTCAGFSECGNGALDGNEFCDPTAGTRFLEYFSYAVPDGFPIWNGACDDYGIGPGTITCTADCQWDVSSCALGGSGDFCTEAGMYGDGTFCDPCDRFSGTPDPDCGSLSCGNGVAEGGEVFAGYPGVGYEWCDGDDLRGADCTFYDFAGGNLKCRDDCQYDYSECTPTVCGDGSVQGREVCDTATAVTQTCADFGYGTGTPTCESDCLGLDFSGCSDYVICDNGIVESGEVCDTSAPLGESCQSLGYQSGSLACASNCRSWNVVGCSGFGDCGNGVLDAFEFCDPSVPGQYRDYFANGTAIPAYATFNGVCDYYYGDSSTQTITCTADCQFDMSPCPSAGSADFCVEIGAYNDGGFCDPCDRLSGTVDPDCPTGSCGDGTADGAFSGTPGYPGSPFEWCDGADLRGLGCTDFAHSSGSAYTSGTLACRPDCNLDFSDCN